MSKYNVSSNEDCVPGHPDILNNYLNTISVEELSQRETEDLESTYQHFTTMIGPDDVITNNIILDMHKRWLGNIYPCAGIYRTVFMSKDGFPFAAPNRIEHQMHKFHENILIKCTPCRAADIPSLALSISMVHVEFILIHPFREGNGRIARLIADIMCKNLNTI